MPVRGEYRALDEALADVLAHYQPGLEGIAAVTGCIVALSHPEWAWWAWLETGTTASVSGGATTSQTLFAVPGDERVYLDSAYGIRASGDNTINLLRVNYPADYRSGASGASTLVDLTTAATAIYWPDEGARQTVNNIKRGPILMEPGTTITLHPAGAGASASTFDFLLTMRRTKLIRARAPT